MRRAAPGLWVMVIFLCLARFCMPASGAVICSSDLDCQRREECRPLRAKGGEGSVKTCQCHHYTFAPGAEPECIAYSWVRGRTGRMRGRGKGRGYREGLGVCIP
jgi:hypothetical protein